MRNKLKWTRVTCMDFAMDGSPPLGRGTHAGGQRSDGTRNSQKKILKKKLNLILFETTHLKHFLIFKKNG